MQNDIKLEAITIPKVPNAIETEFIELLKIIEKFCQEKLNKEYFNLSISLATKIARKRPTPLSSGQINTWAASIIHALGMINFLFDKSQNPYITSKELCDWFNLGQSTISAKSKTIRTMFKMYQLDPAWTLPSKLKDNPMVWMVSINGFIVDVRYAPYDVQIAAYEAGLIPYIPHDKI